MCKRHIRHKRPSQNQCPPGQHCFEAAERHRAVAGAISVLAGRSSFFWDHPRVSRFLPRGTGTSRKVSSFPDPLFILLPLNCHFCQESSVSLFPATPLITITRNDPAVMSSKLLLPVQKEQVGPTAQRPRLHLGKEKPGLLHAIEASLFTQALTPTVL